MSIVSDFCRFWLAELLNTELNSYDNRKGVSWLNLSLGLVTRDMVRVYSMEMRGYGLLGRRLLAKELDRVLSFSRILLSTRGVSIFRIVSIFLWVWLCLKMLMSKVMSRRVMMFIMMTISGRMMISKGLSKKVLFKKSL